MLQITPQIQVDQYYESDALNQSTLKNLIKGLDYFLDKQEKKEDEKNDSFVIGSAVDCILTGNDEDFGNKFHISNMENSPSDAEMEIVNLVFQISEESRPTLEEYPEEILQACLQTGWQKNYKDQTKIDKIIEKGSLYFEELRRSYGKTIITAEQNRLIDTIVKSLRESDNTKNFFDRELYSNLENYTMFLQYPIYFKIDSIDCKALLDMLICEVEDDILVLTPIDIKTTRFFTVDFPNAVRTYRYDIQAAWYTEALWSIKDKLLKEFNCKHLIINNFQFIVESTTKPGKPVIYQATSELIKIGKFGQEEISANKMGIHNLDIDINTNRRIMSPAIKGFDQLLKEYTFYTENGWEIDYKLRNQKENLPVSIDWKGILEE